MRMGITPVVLAAVKRPTNRIKTAKIRFRRCWSRRGTSVAAAVLPATPPARKAATTLQSMEAAAKTRRQPDE